MDMYTYNFNATRIVDGDTIDGIIDLGFGIKLDHRVRLMGMDTPETRTKNKNEKIIGNLAKQRVKDLIHNALTITIKTHLDTAGKFGRILGELFIDNQTISINQLLINEKLAVPYTGSTKLSFEENVANGLLLDPLSL